MTKLIFILITAAYFVYDIIMYILADSMKNKPLPENVRDIYGEGEYKKWRAYKAEHARNGVIEAVCTLAVTAAFFLTDIFSDTYNFFNTAIHGTQDALGGSYIPSIITLALYTAVITLCAMPFSYYGTMVIEGKYGFNKSTQKTFFLDQLKNFLINTVLNTGLMCLVLALYRAMGAYSAVLIFSVLALFTVAFSMLSLPLQKIFNKFTPLEDGELKSDLSALFEKNGYTLGNVYVMDASTRTAKVNAFCSGLGKFKNIVLYDNLVNGYTKDEIIAVFAHELGHYKHKDTAKMTAYSLVMMLALTAAISSLVLIPSVSLDYGFASENVMFAVISAMAVVMNPVMTALTIPAAFLGRHYEYRADKFAAENGYGDAMISSLKKLTKDNMGDLNPHPVIVALEHNHPTVSDRIACISENQRTQNKIK